MRIAILGATSQIAKDLILSFSRLENHELVLFARQTKIVQEWLKQSSLLDSYLVKPYESIYDQPPFDALINFVGVGDPAKAVQMGASIFDLTVKFDSIALDYLHTHPECRYIFLSSGAVYGSDFAVPANENMQASFPMNQLLPHHWYGIAKLHAESRHRALENLAIVDIRVFNYFSHTQNMSAQFLMTDIAKAISERSIFRTSADHVVRDFLHPMDFYQLISRVLTAPKTNCVIDCYSQAPVDKSMLLKTLHEKFDLNYQILDGESGINATGKKPFYYSLNRSASQFGYEPLYSSLDGICRELSLYLQGAGMNSSEAK